VLAGEVAHPAAYAPRDPSEAISDARTRDALGAYSALSNPLPTSPTISVFEPKGHVKGTKTAELVSQNRRVSEPAGRKVRVSEPAGRDRVSYSGEKGALSCVRRDTRRTKRRMAH